MRRRMKVRRGERRHLVVVDAGKAVDLLKHAVLVIPRRDETGHEFARHEFGHQRVVEFGVDSLQEPRESERSVGRERWASARSFSATISSGRSTGTANGS